MNKVIHNTTLSFLGITILSILTLSSISALLLSSTHVFSDTEVIDEVRLTVPVACTMSGTGTTHTAVLSPGTYSGASGNEYENGIGKTTLTAICNDDNGFSIYAIGFTDDEYGVTNLIGDNTSGTIATKAYASGDTTSNWSMKLTKVDNPISGDPVTYNPENLTIETGYNVWHAVPADYTKVAEYHASTGSSTTDTTLGVKLETTYAAYIASSQAADIYKGQVKYTMVHPYDAATPIVPVSIADAEYLQEVNICPEDLQVGRQFTLLDVRDNQEYKAARLVDGKCWIIDNLNIAGGTALSADDTDVSAEYITSFETSNNLTKVNNTIMLPVSATKNDANNNLTDSAQFSQSNYSYVFNSNNKENCGGGQKTPCYSYYSWDAATIGSGRTLAIENTDAEYSICPKGWRLPTSGSSSNNGWKRGDFYTLARAQGANLENQTQDTSRGLSDFLLAGYYSNGQFIDSAYVSGSPPHGAYWSATSASSDSQALDLYLPQNAIHLTDNRRARGFSIRCLLKTN